MGQPKEFTLDKVAWHTQVKDNPETPDRVLTRFRIIVDFLQGHGLTVRSLLQPGEVPSEEFSIRSSDLTDEGLLVMKKGYDKWLKKIVNKNKDVNDVSYLNQVLGAIRDEE